MPECAANFAETTILGGRTQEWRTTALECPALAVHGIAHVGVCHASPPYEVVRLELNGAYLLSCFAGSGTVLQDGRWQHVGAGTAFLAPPRVLLAFKAESGVKWGFTWVRYQLEGLAKPIVSFSSPSLVKFDGEPLNHAVWGLHHEAKGAHSPALASVWARLIHEYVVQFAKPEPGDPRLEKLWSVVAQDLKAPWTLEKMSRVCNLSEEHLRRLCRRELGRSPVHHLIHLRMLHACELLGHSDDKIEVIAHEVGYANAFVFSNTFLRSIGWRPSDYRKKRRSNPSP